MIHDEIIFKANLLWGMATNSTPLWYLCWDLRTSLAGTWSPAAVTTGLSPWPFALLLLPVTGYWVRVQWTYLSYLLLSLPPPRENLPLDGTGLSQERHVWLQWPDSRRSVSRIGLVFSPHPSRSISNNIPVRPCHHLLPLRWRQCRRPWSEFRTLLPGSAEGHKYRTGDARSYHLYTAHFGQYKLPMNPLAAYKTSCKYVTNPFHQHSRIQNHSRGSQEDTQPWSGSWKISSPDESKPKPRSYNLLGIFDVISKWRDKIHMASKCQEHCNLF